MKTFDYDVFYEVMERHLPGIDTTGYPYDRVAHDYHCEVNRKRREIKDKSNEITISDGLDD